MYAYKFPPSTLDAFQNYLDCEQLYERFFGQSEEPSQTFAEYEREQFKTLIDKINRVPFESADADRGTVFNEIIDCMILGQGSTREDVTLHSFPLREVTEDVADAYIEWTKGIQRPCIYGRKGSNMFFFDISLCREVAEYFRGGLPQLSIEAGLETRYGPVLLYGYPDYVREDKVYDLKTTKRYEFGKYAKYWQRHAYPYILTASGKCKDISSFEFTAVQMRGGTARSPLLTGDVYREVYDYDHGQSEKALRSICEQFAEFLEANRHLITDKKIFGGEKE